MGLVRANVVDEPTGDDKLPPSVLKFLKIVDFFGSQIPKVPGKNPPQLAVDFTDRLLNQFNLTDEDKTEVLDIIFGNTLVNNEVPFRQPTARERARVAELLTRAVVGDGGSPPTANKVIQWFIDP